MNPKLPKKSFKEKYTLPERRQDATKKMNENPGYVPIVITLDKRSKIPHIESGK